MASSRDLLDSAGETQVVDLRDLDLSSALEEAAAEERRRTVPPPLPPEARTSGVPAPPLPSLAPPAAAAAPKARSRAFYVAVLAACLVLGVGGGLVVAFATRRPAPHAPPAPSVITIPTVEVDDK